MITDEQKQYFNDRIIEVAEKTGHDINVEINQKHFDRNQMEEALKMLCSARGCMMDKESAGDTPPIKLIRQQRNDIDMEITSLVNTQYIKLSDVFDIFEGLQRVPVAPAGYGGKYDL